MVLSHLELDGKAISAEEILIQGGMLAKGKKPPHPNFAKKRFDYWVAQGKLKLIDNRKEENRVEE